VVASSEAIFLSCLAELITSLAPILKDPTVVIPDTLRLVTPTTLDRSFLAASIPPAVVPS